MIVTLAPQPGPASTGPDEVDPVPLVNPITVSMAVAVTFLVAVLAVVAARPTSADELRGADEGHPAAAAPARVAGASDLTEARRPRAHLHPYGASAPSDTRGIVHAQHHHHRPGRGHPGPHRLATADRPPRLTNTVRGPRPPLPRRAGVRRAGATVLRAPS